MSAEPPGPIPLPDWSKTSLDRFLDACGGTPPLVIEVQDARGGVRRWILPQPFALIGASSRNDLSLHDGQVGRRHVYLQIVDRRIYAIDLGSLAGTSWDGIGRKRCGWLRRGRALHLGPYRLSIPEPWYDAAEAVAPTWSTSFRHAVSIVPREAVGLPAAGFEVRHDNGSVRGRLVLRRVINMLGSHEHTALKFPGPSVAPFHCALVALPDGVWVIDLDGHDRVFLNGAVVRAARVDDGDELRVGPFTLHARIRDDQPEPSSSVIVHVAEPSAMPALAPPTRTVLVHVTAPAPEPAPASLPVLFPAPSSALFPVSLPPAAILQVHRNLTERITAIQRERDGSNAGLMGLLKRIVR
jgi:pSer/pThr/pTyr-binding forkhead associated (FHA) protein